MIDVQECELSSHEHCFPDLEKVVSVILKYEAFEIKKGKGTKASSIFIEAEINSIHTMETVTLANVQIN